METQATIEQSVMARCFKQRQLLGFNSNDSFICLCGKIDFFYPPEFCFSRQQRFLSLQNDAIHYILVCCNSANCESLSCILCNFCFPLCEWAAAGNIQNCHGPWFASTTKLPGWLKEPPSFRHRTKKGQNLYFL